MFVSWKTRWTLALPDLSKCLKSEIPLTKLCATGVLVIACSSCTEDLLG